MGNLFFGDATNPIDEIKTIFSQYENPVAAAQDWATTLLQAKGIDPVESPTTAARELRKQEKAFGLKSATYLVSKLSD